MVQTSHLPNLLLYSGCIYCSNGPEIHPGPGLAYKNHKSTKFLGFLPVPCTYELIYSSHFIGRCHLRYLHFIDGESGLHRGEVTCHRGEATQPVNGEAGIGTGNPGSRFCLACPGEAMLITPSNSGHLSPNCTGGMSCPDTYNSLFFTGIPFLWCHPSTLLISTLQPEGAFKSASWGTSLMVQWLRLCVAAARGTGSIPGWGTKDPT